MTVAWVLGRTGLLGGALSRKLRDYSTELFIPAKPVPWGRSPAVLEHFQDSIKAFSSRLSQADRWEIYWAAGVGTMSSCEEDLVSETEALFALLRLLKADVRLMAMPGAIAFASSAGGIYAGTSEGIIDEYTQTAPTTAYAREKLKQESLIQALAAENSRLSILIGRITTLYGPGQALGKKQGLLAHIARSLVRRKNIHIYVSYGTVRDYIFSDDAATELINVLREIGRKPAFVMKIIASERPTTIAEIISIFKRVSRRAPLIVMSRSDRTGLYLTKMQFRSVVLPEFRPSPKKSLPIGVSQLLAAEQAAFARGPRRPLQS